MKTYKGIITELLPNEVFVFGSNTQGRHGKGSALIAKQKFGAIYGQAKGLQGQSYAIVTKDLTARVHPSISVTYILTQIKELYLLASQTPDKLYYIAYNASGINLNGYSNLAMAHLFGMHNIIPDNIVFEEEFSKLVYSTTNQIPQ